MWSWAAPACPTRWSPTPVWPTPIPQALFQLGKALRSHPAFPKGANVNFYESTGPDQVLEKTFERGVEDFTLACGTGTGSVVAVLTLLGQVSGPGVQVSMAGGVLTIDVARTGDRITASGSPAPPTLWPRERSLTRNCPHLSPPVDNWPRWSCFPASHNRI